MSDVVVKQVKAIIQAGDESAPGIASFESRLEALRAKAEQSGSNAGKGFMDRLNEQFGRSSETSHLLHALEGAGIAAAIGLGARMVAEIGGKMRETTEALAEGKMKAEELPEAFVKSVPVLGNIYDGIKDIAESLDGTAAKTAIWKAELENVSRGYETIKGLQEIAQQNALGVGEEGEDGAERRAERRAGMARRSVQERFNDAYRKAQEDVSQAKQGVSNAQENVDSYLRPLSHLGGGDQAKFTEAEARLQTAQSNLHNLEKARDQAFKKIEEDRQRELARETEKADQKQKEDEQREQERQQRESDRIAEASARKAELDQRRQEQDAERAQREADRAKDKADRDQEREQRQNESQQEQTIRADEHAEADVGRQIERREELIRSRHGTAAAESAGGLTGLAIAAETRAHDTSKDETLTSLKSMLKKLHEATEIAKAQLALMRNGPVLVGSSQASRV